jgi:hypothetical protein
MYYQNNQSIRVYCTKDNLENLKQYGYLKHTNRYSIVIETISLRTIVNGAIKQDSQFDFYVTKYGFYLYFMLYRKYIGIQRNSFVI